MAGTIVADTLQDGAGNSTAMDNAIYGSAKAWARFQGGNGNTSGVILASYNVSSITTVSTGIYIVNYTSALTDANYSAVATFSFNITGGNGYTSIMVGGQQSASSCYVFGINSSSGANNNAPYVNFSAFR
jgi:hypothetical protein